MTKGQLNKSQPNVPPCFKHGSQVEARLEEQKSADEWSTRSNKELRHLLMDTLTLLKRINLEILWAKNDGKKNTRIVVYKPVNCVESIEARRVLHEEGYSYTITERLDNLWLLDIHLNGGPRV